MGKIEKCPLCTKISYGWGHYCTAIAAPEDQYNGAEKWAIVYHGGAGEYHGWRNAGALVAKCDCPGFSNVPPPETPQQSLIIQDFCPACGIYGYPGSEHLCAVFGHVIRRNKYSGNWYHLKTRNPITLAELAAIGNKLADIVELSWDFSWK